MALSGAEQFAEAMALIGELAADRPRLAPLRVRSAELLWKSAPSPVAAGRVVSLVDALEGHAEAVTAAARVLVDQGSYVEVLALIDGMEVGRPTAEQRVLAARSLRRLGRPRDALALVSALEGLTGRSGMLRAEFDRGGRGARARGLDLRVPRGPAHGRSGNIPCVGCHRTGAS